MTTLNRDAVPIGDDIEPVAESRVDVEIGNEEEEKSSEEGIPTVEINTKSPTSGEEQEPEDCGHAVYRSWERGSGSFVSKLFCAGKRVQAESLEEEERERINPMIAFDRVSLTQENADTFPIPICRYNRHGAISLLFHLIKHHDFLRITLEYKNEPNPKVFQDAMTHSCVEGFVREMNRRCRTLRISAEHNTSVRITDDSPFLDWIPHFAMQFLHKMRTGRGWRK